MNVINFGQFFKAKQNFCHYQGCGFGSSFLIKKRSDPKMNFQVQNPSNAKVATFVLLKMILIVKHA